MQPGQSSDQRTGQRAPSSRGLQAGQRPSLNPLGPSGIGPLFMAAPQPDLIRALEKDQAFINNIKEDCRELAATLLGSRASNYEHSIDFLVDACYHGVTMLAGCKSLGEEYLDLRMVCNDLESTPSLRRRIMLFFFEACVPYLFVKLSSLPHVWPHSPSTGLLTRLWRRTLEWFAHAEPVLALVNKIHLALFYLFGQYLQLSKRLVGIRYVLVRKLDIPRPGYGFLGVLLVIHLSMLFIMSLHRARVELRQQSVRIDSPGRNERLPAKEEMEGDRKHAKDGPATDVESDPIEGPECSICYCPRTHPTITECGHIFCWECITTSCVAKPVCPMCRSPCPPSQLLLLNHYQ
jgi:peroxin-10